MTHSLTIRSGGQTGVDRAALDVALEWGLRVTGWCPAGRWAEDGPIDARYPLQEAPGQDPAVRTLFNVRDADVTLILTPLPLAGGTALTHTEAVQLGRPVRVYDPWSSGDVPEAVAWVDALGADLDLNVAGPRESEAPGVYDATRRFLGAVLGRLGGG